MNITLFGAIWIVLIIVSMFRPIKFITTMLLISFVFQAAAILNVGSIGLDVPLFTCCCFLCRAFIGNQKIKLYKIDMKVLTVCLVAILSIFIAAIFFSKVRVFSSIDIYLKEVVFKNLKIGTDNLTMIIPLLVYSLVLIQLNVIARKLSSEFVDNVFRLALIIVLFFGAWQWLETMGFMPKTFLGELIYSNTAHYESIAYGKNVASYNSRIFSTFSEPSYAGVFLAGSFWYLIATKQKKKREYIFLVCTLIELIINMSGSGIAAFVTGGICFLFFSSKISNTKKISVCVIGIIMLIALEQIGIVSTVVQYTIRKTGSASYFERMTANQLSIEIFRETSFFGAGYGTVRASGIIQNILGQMGILGLASYSLFIYALIKVSEIHSGQRLFLFAIIGAQLISCADITLSIFWFVAFLIKISSLDCQNTNYEKKPNKVLLFDNFKIERIE